jgi:hypothetical protein
MCLRLAFQDLTAFPEIFTDAVNDRFDFGIEYFVVFLQNFVDLFVVGLVNLFSFGFV